MYRNTQKKLIYLLAASLTACGMSGAALAQTTTETIEAGKTVSPNEIVLDEIVVTAQRRTESIQDVPVAVSAFSQDMLQARQINDVQSLKSVVPNVVIEDVPGGSSSIKLFLRGVGTDNPVFSGDGAVGVYIDDVFISRAIGANFDLYDIERVEVLRGPQGTLYGRNSSAGALKIQTASPILDKTVLKGEFALGTEGFLESKAVFNAPIIENVLAVRASAFTSQHDPVQENLIDGTEALDKDVSGARAKLLWQVSDDVDILLTGDIVRERALPNMAVAFRDQDTNFDGTNDYVFDGNLFSYESGLADIFQNTDNAGISNRIGWALSDDLTLTSTTAYRELDFEIRADVDGVVASRFEPNQRLENSTFSQEINLSGSTEKVDWVTGLFYFREESDFLWDLTVFANLGAPQNFQFFNQETESIAGYAQATVNVSDKFNLTGGVRYTEETKDFTVDGFTETGLAPGAGEDPVGAPVFSFTDDIEFDNVSYRLGADYDISDNTMLYASYSTGYRSGGFNGGARSLAEVSSPPFAEETVDTAEIGLKSYLLGERLRMNLTYFESDFEDLQEAALRAEGFSTDTANAEISGFEVEATALISDNFSLSFQGGTLDGEILETGNDVKYTPDVTYSVSADLDWPLANGGVLFLNGTVSYEDDYFINVENQPEVVVPEHTLVDARIGYKSSNESWEVELVAKNLFDEEYPTHGFFIDLPGPPAGPGTLSTIQFPNRPKMIILRTRLSF